MFLVLRCFSVDCQALKLTIHILFTGYSQRQKARFRAIAHYWPGVAVCDVDSGMPDNFTILIAEDDRNDAFLLELAIRKNEIPNAVHIVEDGQQALDYLEGKGKFGDRRKYAFPRVVITDLKMPRMNGFEVLKWIRGHPKCSVLPTILLSGSGLAADVIKAYRLGANSYFQKPATLHELTELVRVAHQYWAHCETPVMSGTC